MAIIDLWPYAEGYYYLDFRTHILHIMKDTPKEIAERLTKDVEDYIPKSISLFEKPDLATWKLTSRDFYVKQVVQD